MFISPFFFFFFFNDTATTEIYTLSLHDALPICVVLPQPDGPSRTRNSPSLVERSTLSTARTSPKSFRSAFRSEEHTSELQSRLHLVCRLLLEKKKKHKKIQTKNVTSKASGGCDP